MMAMTYGNVYVARIAMGASPAQTVKAFVEAEAHEGPSLIIAYSHCIAHGINMTKGMEQQKKAVASGSWPLYRFNPALATEGKNPLTFESKEPSLPYEEYAYSENRFRTLKAKNPKHAAVLMEHAEAAVKNHFSLYKKLASLKTDE